MSNPENVAQNLEVLTLEDQKDTHIKGKYLNPAKLNDEKNKLLA